MLLAMCWLVQEVFNTIYFSMFGDGLPSSSEMHVVGTVSKLCLYPLKSGHRVETDRLQCEPMAPCVDDIFDRTLVATDEQGGFLTARRYPEMVRITVQLLAGAVRLSAPHTAPLLVRFCDVIAADRHCQVRVWSDLIPALDCGDAAAAWLARAIPSRVDAARLRFFAGRRSARPAADGAAFADLTGYLLVSEASVAELNGRLERAVAADNFRANIVVAGGAAYAEDGWRYLAAGGAVFENVKPCTRCVLTTVDPETGARDALGQPLSTLKQYRLGDDEATRQALRGSPRFGINLGVRRRGVVRVGDVVYASL